MRSRTFAHGFLIAALFAAPSIASVASAQASPTQAGTPALTKEQIASLAKLAVAIGVARDSAQARYAEVRNKNLVSQQQLHDQLAAQIAGILSSGGMTHTEYERETFIVSTDSAARRQFDATIAQITGVPTPGQVVASVAAPATAAIKLPPGAVGVHIGHVVSGFSDTPNGQGLLPTALAEAKTAATHAALAARAPANLDAMKMHAGHVINAVDPTIEPKGPGLGYGVKKATMGVATHIELAAKAPGASQNVITHANHIATAARNTVARCDQVVAVAKQIQAATSAEAAAALVNQLVSLTAQLTSGVDTNADGKITWQEGGLQQAQEHVTLMLAGEGSTH